MGALAWAKLLGWKLRCGTWATWERAGGLALLDATAVRWAERSLGGEAAGSFAMDRWLARSGGGRFWWGSGTEWFAETCSELDRTVGAAAANGVFHLLGSGAAPTGAPPEWRRDLYTGREWPLEPSAGYRLVRGEGSDIRTVWELSRGYHLLPLARLHASEGDGRWARLFAGHLTSWMEQNPLGRGPHWASPMDLAIRCANWIVAMHGFSGSTELGASFWRSVLRQLYASGLYLERHLEWHPVFRGNHYVANGVGLVYLGGLFRDDRRGRRWLERGSGILLGEMERQVGADGVSFESSLAYHRLVTELFAYGGEVVRLNRDGGLPPGFEDRLTGMYRFITAYLPPGGEAPMIGDADDGRLHAVSVEGLLEPRRHRMGLPHRAALSEAAGPGAYPQGGFYVLRGGADHVVIRCGRVGIFGAGSHDHNDQLSLELVLGGVRVLSDSGSYCYTRDLEARHRFRSTAAHSVPQLGGEEQNPIRPERPWRMLEDRTRSRCTEWAPEGEIQRFTGQHHGFAHRESGAVCSRIVELSPGSGRCTIRDDVDGVGTEELSWRLHFAPGLLEVLSGASGRWLLRWSGPAIVDITVEASERFRLEIGSSAASDRYGASYLRPLLTLSGEVMLPTRVEARMTLKNDDA